MNIRQIWPILLILISLACQKEDPVIGDIGNEVPVEDKYLNIEQFEANKLQFFPNDTLKASILYFSNDTILSVKLNEQPIDFKDADGLVQFQYLVPDTLEAGTHIWQIKLETGTLEDSVDFQFVLQTEILPEGVELKENAFMLREGDIQQIQGDTIIISGQMHYQPGQVLSGPNNGGYLKRVVEIREENGQQVLITEDAQITDLYQNAELEFNFNTSPSSRSNGLPEARFKESFRSEILNQGPLYASVAGEFSLNATPNLKISIQDGQLVYAKFWAENITFSSKFLYEIKASGKHTVADSKYSFLKKKIPFVAGFTFGYIELELEAAIQSMVEAEVNLSTESQTQYTMSVSAEFSQSRGWTGDVSYDKISEGGPKLMGNIKSQNTITISPILRIMLYGVAGPYIKPDFRSRLSIEATTGLNPEISPNPISGWYAALNFETGIEVGFEEKLLRNRYSKHSGFVIEPIWWGPHELKFVEDDDYGYQLVNPSKPQALKVMAIDIDGNPMVGVPVYIGTDGNNVGKGDEVITDADGIATYQVQTLKTGPVYAAIFDPHLWTRDYIHKRYYVIEYGVSVYEKSTVTYGDNAILKSFETEDQENEIWSREWYVNGKKIEFESVGFGYRTYLNFNKQFVPVGKNTFRCKIYKRGQLYDDSGDFSVEILPMELEIYDGGRKSNHFQEDEQVYLFLSNHSANAFYSFNVKWFSNGKQIHATAPGEFQALSQLLPIGTHSIVAKVYHDVTGEFIQETEPYQVMVYPKPKAE